MVVQDKWKKRATIAYRKKHNIQVAPPKPHKKDLGTNEWRFQEASEFFDGEQEEEEFPSLESLKQKEQASNELEGETQEEEVDYSKLQARPLTGMGIGQQRPKAKIKSIKREEVQDVLQAAEHEKSIQDFRKRYNVEKPIFRIPNASGHVGDEEDIDDFLKETESSELGTSQNGFNSHTQHPSKSLPSSSLPTSAAKDQSWLDDLLR
ncbi:Schizosaccharomyces specific protein [Schizosaccharomyces osmophilus]|uniref:Schizosaccharomyces specific protein n=1 Tax=Schizosaccharomyces osmophilus TaxID=2545709 RepID=A0AAE9WEJ1_9SCHI|nr:Schizosaccharomyces specific protein [Schizosaccharomyces osmophilus]WBW74936.1 Schizosaccharomyces specific protein [Schizosaccharomyces osmophilus]